MNQRGFTLLEVLLSVTIIAMVAGLSLPFYLSFQTRNELDISTTTVVDMLRRAQNYSRNGNGDSQWGVALQSGNATLFKGSSYSARDTSYDETWSMGAVTNAGMSEVTYSKVAAAPNTSGTITLTSTPTNETRTITLNAKGMVNY